MADFKGVAEKFTVHLLPDDGHRSEKVICQIGLEGLALLNFPEGQRTLRKYPLNHISRWALRGTNLVLYTKTPVDVEERTVTLQADDRTIRSVLDTLTCSCMQMCEILQSEGRTGDERQAANSLTQLLNSAKKKLPTADEVEFWKDPEKTGWLHSQGEHIKTWRRRWFILKQGFLFRFASPDVNSTSKPRGIVDLSKVQDVTDGRDVTGRPNSLKLSTGTGHVCYLADGETELVEWMSALEGAVSKIVRQVAGVDDEPAPAPKASASTANSSSRNDWAKQFERNFAANAAGSPTRTDKNTMVKIVGYDTGARPTAPTAVADPYNYGGYSYGDVHGIAGVAGSDSRRHAEPVVQVNYPSYPSLTPTPAQATSQQYSYGNSGTSSNSYYGAESGYQPPAQAQQSTSQTASYDYYSQHQPQNDDTQAQQYAHAPQAPQQPSNSAWQVHYTAEGRAYYFNSTTGVTQWEPPTSLV